MGNKSKSTVIFSTRVNESKAKEYNQTCSAAKIERSAFIRDALDSHNIYLNETLSRRLAFQNSYWGRVQKEDIETAKVVGSLVGLVLGCGLVLLTSK